MKSADFIVARKDLQQCKLIETQLPDAAALPEDALLIKVDRFAFTANNITYAVLGDQLKYWQLFPAPENFGNIPVWGFGEVNASNHPGIAVGERLSELGDVPTLVLWGNEDRVICATDAGRLRDHASAEVHVARGTGHMLPLEAAAWTNARRLIP